VRLQADSSTTDAGLVVTIKLPPVEHREEMDRSLVKVGKDVIFHGFRRGRAPVSLLRKHGSLVRDADDDCFRRFMEAARAVLKEEVLKAGYKEPDQLDFGVPDVVVSDADGIIKTVTVTKKKPEVKTEPVVETKSDAG